MRLNLRTDRNFAGGAALVGAINVDIDREQRDHHAECARGQQYTYSELPVRVDLMEMHGADAPRMVLSLQSPEDLVAIGQHLVDEGRRLATIRDGLRAGPFSLD